MRLIPAHVVKAVGSVGLLSLVTRRVYRVPTAISIVLMFFQQFSGINAVTFYAVQIFQDTGSDMAADAAIYLGLISMVATLVTLVTVDRLGRRLLLIVSGFLMAASILGIAVFFLLQEDVRLV